MAYVIVTEGLHDQAYLDRHVLGFDEAHLPAGAPAGASYRAYLLGEIDGVPKTPEWAAAITGMPAETLRALAREYATSKPAALQTGYAPGRTLHGEQFHRAAYALCAMTGNVGIPGGNAGTSNGATGRGGIQGLPTGENPVDGAGLLAAARRPARARAGRRLPGRREDDLLVRGRSLQPAPQRPAHRRGGGAARLRGGPGPLRDAHRALRRHRAARDDVLGAQRRPHPVGGGRPLRDLHAAGDRAGGRVPQRPRHLRGAGRAPRHRGLQRQDGRRVAARADEADHRRLRDVPGPGPRPPARPGRRGGLRAGDPRARAPPVHARRPARSRSTRWPSRPSPIPTASAPSRRSRPGSRSRSTRATRCACSPPSRARAPTRSTTTRRCWPAPIATTCGCTRRTRRPAASWTASASRVFNDRGRTLIPVRVTDRVAPGRGLDQGGRVVRPRRARSGHARLLESPDARPLLARRGHALQLLLRGDRAPARPRA